MGKAIDEKLVKKSLKTLKASCREGNLISLRKAIFKNYGEIRELMEHGYTRDQIRVQLQTDLGITISKDTFCNYMMAAKQMFSGKLPYSDLNGSLEDMHDDPPVKKVDDKKKHQCDTIIPDVNMELVKSSDELKDKFNHFNNDLDAQYEKYIETLENKG